MYFIILDTNIIPLFCDETIFSRLKDTV